MTRYMFHLFGLEECEIRRALLQMAQLESQIALLQISPPHSEPLRQIPIRHPTLPFAVTLCDCK